MTPADIVLVPFITIALFVKPSMYMNDLLQKFQFYILLFVYYLIFASGTILMMPFAYLKSLGSKLHILSSRSYTNKDLAMNALNLTIMLFFGLLIFIFNFMMDSFYFWRFNIST